MHWGKLSKGLAAAQIATTIATVPINEDGTPDLIKQYAQYARHVKLDNIHRTTRKDTTKTRYPVAVLDKRTAKNLRGR